MFTSSRCSIFQHKIPYCVPPTLLLCLVLFGIACCWSCDFERRKEINAKKKSNVFLFYWVDVSWRQSGRRMIWVTVLTCDAYRRWWCFYSRNENAEI